MSLVSFTGYNCLVVTKLQYGRKVTEKNQILATTTTTTDVCSQLSRNMAEKVMNNLNSNYYYYYYFFYYYCYYYEYHYCMCDFNLDSP